MITENTPLSEKQIAFCYAYVETNNAAEAARRAGYSERTARSQGQKLLTKPNIAFKIDQLKKEQQSASIATAQEVMEYFTKVMNGEIKDQFGLEAPLAERTKAAQELAKRTVDWDNRAKGVADAKIEIKLDWGDNE